MYYAEHGEGFPSMLQTTPNTRKHLLKHWIHAIALCILIFSFVYAEPQQQTKPLSSDSATTRHTEQENSNDDEDLEDIDELLASSDDKNNQEALLSEESLAQIDASVQSWNPKTAIANHPRLKGKDLDKIKIQFFLKKISDIDPSDNKFTAQFYVKYSLPLARSYLNTRSEILSVEKQKDSAQLNNVLQHITHDSREVSEKHPGLYTLISKYLKHDNITFNDIKHAMTQHESIELELYYLAMNLQVDAVTGNPLPGRLIQDDSIHNDEDLNEQNIEEDNDEDLVDIFGAAIEDPNGQNTEENHDEDLNDEDLNDEDLFGEASVDSPGLNTKEDYDSSYLSRAQYICHKYNQNQPRGAADIGLCDVIKIQEKKIVSIYTWISQTEQTLDTLKTHGDAYDLEQQTIKELNKYKKIKADLLRATKQVFNRLNLDIQCVQNPKEPCIFTEVNNQSQAVMSLKQKLNSDIKELVKQKNSGTKSQEEINAELRNHEFYKQREQYDQLKAKLNRMLATLDHARPSQYTYNPLKQLLTKDYGPVIFKHDLQHTIGDLFLSDETELSWRQALFKKQYPAITALIESYIHQQKITDQSIRKSIERLADDHNFTNIAEKNKEIAKILEQLKQAKTFKQSIINQDKFASYLNKDPWSQFHIPNAKINNIKKLDSRTSRGIVTLAARYNATIKTNYNLAEYPFDSQTFTITIADRHNTSKLHNHLNINHDFKFEYQYPKRAIFDKNSFPAGWKLINHKTIFTDLANTGNGKESAMIVILHLKRDNPRLFFSTFATLYLSYVLSLIAISLTNKISFFTAKNALLLGSIFSLMSNINSTQDLLKNHVEGMSLIDKFQVTTMTLLIISIFTMYLCIWWNQNGMVKRARIVRITTAIGSALVFIATNILLLT
jgi:hypothetical protein